MSKKYVCLFKEGNKDMRSLLGGKGANLAEMTNIGLPVPQGLTITTEACNKYFADGNKLSDEVLEQVWEKFAIVEEQIGKKSMIRQSVNGFRSFRCSYFHARYDGYYFELGYE